MQCTLGFFLSYLTSSKNWQPFSKIEFSIFIQSFLHLKKSHFCISRMKLDLEKPSELYYTLSRNQHLCVLKAISVYSWENLFVASLSAFGFIQVGALSTFALDLFLKREKCLVFQNSKIYASLCFVPKVQRVFTKNLRYIKICFWDIRKFVRFPVESF